MWLGRGSGNRWGWGMELGRVERQADGTWSVDHVEQYERDDVAELLW